MIGAVEKLDENQKTRMRRPLRVPPMGHSN